MSKRTVVVVKERYRSSDSPAAQRMRRSRQRRRDGLRCLRLELRETEIDQLVRRGLLRTAERNDPSAITEALYLLFYQYLR